MDAGTYWATVIYVSGQRFVSRRFIYNLFFFCVLSVMFEPDKKVLIQCKTLKLNLTLCTSKLYHVKNFESERQIKAKSKKANETNIRLKLKCQELNI